MKSVRALREWRMTSLVILLGAPALVVLAFGACAASGDARTPRRVLQRPAPPWEHQWSRGAVFYEVFVRSFADSDGDGIGDLKGLTAKLDYLNDGDPATTTDLGVTALWLMPVFASPSYHGYDTTDYERINPAYGTNEDFETLCREAHRRGIRVILDLVINHSGWDHPWFQASRSSESSPYRSWYVWRPDNPGWKQPWNVFGGADTWHRNEVDGHYYYGVFWKGMPDLNLTTPAVREEVKRLAALWLRRGADGFRLDAARYLIETGPGFAQADTPETHAFWKEFATFVRRLKPDATLVGESWAETAVIAAYYGSTATVPEGDELPMCFNFPLGERILQAVRTGSADGIAAKYAEMARHYPAGVNDAPFLTNHDMVRLATQLDNNPGRLRTAASILLTLPGAPFLYYGEEVGLQNGGTGSADELKRTPMPWDGSAGGGFTTGTPWHPFAPGRDTANVAVHTGNPSSLLSRYRALIHTRNASEALQKGNIHMLTATSGYAPLLVFLRVAPGERVLVAHNLADSYITSSPLLAFDASGFDPLLVDPGVPVPTGTSGAWRLGAMPPRATGIWRLR
ncbi:MAG TPA: alpha-amylase family glycosyl hydrolase [Thermoanaerobaculaceae bacterium]|nr:alpha-amylase family glycosyl hydrolase [Thermoanaerobaculaceae bacterium]HRS17506.1 alpha-amylase family glycosyl hydrolase [Thermoanaerobaculaceae bacterium]